MSFTTTYSVWSSMAFLASRYSIGASMTVVSGVVALIILYLVTSLLIEENRNTISLLKIFGYRRREIRFLILNSSTLVIVAGFITGIPLALASMGAVYGYLGKTDQFNPAVYCESPSCGNLFCCYHPDLPTQRGALCQVRGDNYHERGAKSGNGIEKRVHKVKFTGRQSK